jgi:hypothetical protein
MWPLTFPKERDSVRNSTRVGSVSLSNIKTSLGGRKDRHPLAYRSVSAEGNKKFYSTATCINQEI